MPKGRTPYDVVVIGAGPGGYTASIRAAQLGMKAALVEAESELGGVCLNWGCIPTKALLRQAELYRLFQRADEFGFSTGEVTFDWTKVVERSRRIAAQLASGVEYLVEKNGIDVYRGWGRLTPVKDVEVAGAGGKVSETLESRHILVASGGRPRTLKGVEIDGNLVLSSRHAMTLENCPASIAIVGAGPIGVEFAYFFNTFGVEVTLLEAEAQILPREDEEIGALLRESLEAQGVTILTGAHIKGIEVDKKGVAAIRIETPGESKTREVKAEKVLMAVGVQGNTDGMGLEGVGVRVTRAGIAVDEHLETSVRGIYAVGDATGAPQLAHAATAEGITAVEHMAGRDPQGVDAVGIPSCIYCQPQVASVGLTESQAREAGHDVRVGRLRATRGMRDRRRCNGADRRRSAWRERWRPTPIRRCRKR